MFDPENIRQVALALRTVERYVEKDWHLIRALSAIARLEAEGVTPIFSGGTSLASAWQLLRRFSEDIDFKVAIEAPSANAARKVRSDYRERVIDALQAIGLVLEGEPLVGNMSRFFRASFQYGVAMLPHVTGIRPTLQIEMTFSGTHLPPRTRSAQSLLARALKAPPEVPSLLCVDPVETAADKLSALAWRTAARNRAAASDDPAIVRHLHDLAALEAVASESNEFPALARVLLDSDAKRAGDSTASGLELLSAMLPKIESDPIWRDEYEKFVGAVSFGADAERIGYDDAIAACARLIATVEGRTA